MSTNDDTRPEIHASISRAGHTLQELAHAVEQEQWKLACDALARHRNALQTAAVLMGELAEERDTEPPASLAADTEPVR